MAHVISAGVTERDLLGLDLLIDVHERFADRGDVPVWLVRDDPAGAVLRFVTRIANVVESQRFKKDLRRGGDPLVAAWARVKKRLAADATPKGLHFEKVQGSRDLFTVRIDRSLRALLRFEGADKWTAERIGSHDLVYG